ncbi:GNAT family N-acetyltransferase, partial [Crocinitomix catalasitica]|nr:GNAT family N-acetyltransferase [Crocinitomix catalasitica]
LYPILESNDYRLESRLKNEHRTEGGAVDVVIHSKRRSALKLRKVAEDDLMKVYNWSNDPSVRSQSYNSAEITLDEHKTWFAKLLENENAFMFIGLKDQVDVGMVRIREEDEETVIGVLVDKNHRGQGFAAELVKLGCKEWRKINSSEVTAYIKKDNKASVAAFEKAGFRLSREEVHKGSPSYIYILNSDR